MTPPTATSTEHPPESWNDTAVPFDQDATVSSLVRVAARTHPGRPALVTSAGSIVTHAELDRWTNQIARVLNESGIGRGSFVALYSHRTPHAVAALIAVLKTGASYVPIDVAWPVRRVTDLLSALRVECVIAGQPQLKVIQEIRWEVLSLKSVLCPEIDAGESWTPLLDREIVEEFFDFLSGESDPIAAAGFNLRRSDRPYTDADVAAYRDHVAALALQAAGPGAAILEVGCGSGLISAALAPQASRYLVVDPSTVAVERNRDSARQGGYPIEGAVLYAHEVADAVTGPFDLIIMASTVQFLPDMDYFLTSLRSLIGLLAPGGGVLLADLIDPALENHAGLRIPRVLLACLPALLPSVTTVEVMGRSTRVFAGELATRYDTLIRVGTAPTADYDDSAWSLVRVRTGADIAVQSPSALPESAGRSDIAYAIFTSGSTGTPKAVLVPHRAVVNLVDWVSTGYKVGPDDRILFITSFCFDLSVYDIFGVLAVGGSVHVTTDAEVAEPGAIADLLETGTITIWDSAPAVLTMVMPFLQIEPAGDRSRLRLVLVSGDWVPLALPDEVRAAFPLARLVALGGATECTVWSNHYLVDTVDPQWASIPYGKPIQNARYYVLGDDLAPCQVGEAGDLYIAGECVATGYWAARGLTASKFPADPWSAAPGKRMYRTGDRARWLPSGHLEFLGRLDDQVKVRGYRIELGEVQAAVAQCPGVRAAVVLAVASAGGERSDRELVAFYIPAGQPAPAAALRESLLGLLPSYMVPSRIVPVESFPLGATGKVDRAALTARL